MRLADVTRGRGVFRAQAALTESQWWSADKLRELAEAKLAVLVRHAFDHTTYYRRRLQEAGLGRESGSLESLRSLPLLTKDEIREDPQGFRSGVHDEARLKPNQTGGSSGSTLHFFVDRSAWRQREAIDLRWHDFVGVEPGARHLFVWGVPETNRTSASLRERLGSWMRGQIAFPASRLGEQGMAEILAAWRRYRPAMVTSFTSILGRLAEYAEATGWSAPANGVIIATAESLGETERRRIESTFGLPVLNQYGSREFGLIGMECRQGRRLHLMAERLWAENASVEDGHSEELVLTDLDNFGFPLIRYRTGDLARIEGGVDCACGRGLPVMGPVEGRVYDLIRGPNGNVVGGTFFSILLRERVPGLRQYQVVQEAPDRFRVRVSTRNGVGDEIRAQVRAEFERVLGPVDLQWEILERLEPLPSGKHRFVVGLAPERIGGEDVR